MSPRRCQYRGIPVLTGGAVLAAALLATLGAPAAFAQTCDGAPTSTLRIVGTEHDGLTAVPATMAEIDREADAHSIPERMRHEPLVLIVPQLTSTFAVDEKAVKAAPGVFCAAPAQVELRMGITDYRVFIERTAFADDCVRDELLEHARRHLEADNRELLAVIERVREPLGERLTALKRTPAATAEEAVSRLKAGVADLLLHSVEDFGHARTAQDAWIDTPEALDRLSAACDGHVRVLDTQARTPGRDA